VIEDLLFAAFAGATAGGVPAFLMWLNGRRRLRAAWDRFDIVERKLKEGAAP